MRDKFLIKLSEQHKKIIKSHLDEIVSFYGGVNEAHYALKIAKPTIWYWKTFKQRLEPKHAVYICSRCKVARLDKLIPQYRDIFK